MFQYSNHHKILLDNQFDIKQVILLKMILMNMKHKQFHLHMLHKLNNIIYMFLYLNQDNIHQDNINYMNQQIRMQYYNLNNYLFQHHYMLNKLDHTICKYVLKHHHTNYLNKLLNIRYQYKMLNHYISNKQYYHYKLNNLKYMKYKQYLFYMIQLDMSNNIHYCKIDIHIHKLNRNLYQNQYMLHILLNKYHILNLLYQ